jgi:hypothetical protein
MGDCSARDAALCELGQSSIRRCPARWHIPAAGIREIKSFGVIEEKIDWTARYFIPTGKDGVPVLEALFKSKPLIDLSVKDSGLAPAFSRAAERNDTTGFYSALAREIDALPTKAAPAPGWQMAIQGMVKNGKVKADELEWSGLTDWLKLQTGKVTKEQITGYLDANGVQVQEVVLGQPSEADIEALLNDEVGEGMTRDEAIEYLSKDEGATPTKYQQYTLPGGENYREVLLTLPRREITTGAVAERLFGKPMSALSEDERDQVAAEMRRTSDSSRPDNQSVSRY